MAWVLRGDLKLPALSVVVFIKVHSGFGHEESSRVIGMIKTRSI